MEKPGRLFDWHGAECAARRAGAWPKPLVINGHWRAGLAAEGGAVARPIAAPTAAGKPALAAAQQAKQDAQDQQGPEDFQNIFHVRK